MIELDKNSLAFEINNIERDTSISSQHKIFLSDLMPYSLSEKCGAQLRLALKEYQMLLNTSFEALEALDAGKFEKFDALVGENACQIRAVWIAIIALTNLLPIAELKKKLSEVNNKINLLLQEKTISTLMSSGISLKKLFLSEKLFISLSINDLFVIQCYFLREAKSVDYEKLQIDSFFIKERCDPKRLKKFGEISSSFADRLVSKARKTIARISVQLVRESAWRSQDVNLIQMLSDEFTLLHNNHLLCTPMFWTYKSVLFAAKQEGIQFVIQAKFLKKNKDSYNVIDEEWLLFDVDGCWKKLSLMELNKTNSTQVPYVVVQGLVYLEQRTSTYKEEWLQNISNYHLETIILAGAADHRQYPSQGEDEVIHSLQDQEYETFISLSRSQGFAFDQPTTLFIQHVYPSNSGEIANRLSSVGNLNH